MFLSGLYVIFDLYGTLVDWIKSISGFIESFISSSAVEEFFKCDLEQTSSGVYKPYREILGDCLSRVALKYGVLVSSDIKDSFITHFAKSPPFPDTIYGIKLLKTRGFKVGVLSNIDKDLVEITLCGVRGMFDFIVTAEDVKAYKPRREAFIRTYKALGVTPLEVVHVSAYPQYDLEPARELGAKTILVNRGYGYKWYVSVNSLVELADILEKIA